MDIFRWREELLESPLSYRAKFVGLVLSQYYRENHPTYPSIRTLSQQCSLTVNPIQSGIKELCDAKFVLRQQRRVRGSSHLINNYIFLCVSSDDTSHDTSHDTSSDDTEYSLNSYNNKNNNRNEFNKKVNIDSWEEKNGELSAMSFQSFAVEKGIPLERIQGMIEKFRHSCQAHGYEYENFEAAFRSWDWAPEQTKKGGKANGGENRRGFEQTPAGRVNDAAARIKEARINRHLSGSAKPVN